jgi:hypothetical protein
MSAEADQYRAFARECIKWSWRAQTIEHREVLLDMATYWAKAAARLDCQHGLTNDAAAWAGEAKAETNGDDQQRRQLDAKRGDTFAE